MTLIPHAERPKPGTAIEVQTRVIIALVLREVHTLYGNARLGYIWALVQTSYSIFLFWIIRSLAGTKAPHGMHILFFLLAGFGLFNMFGDILSKSMGALSGNKKLFMFPQITPLDVLISRFILVWVTSLVSISIITFVALLVGVNIIVSDFGGLLSVIIIMPMLGLGVGMCCSAISVLFPTFARILPIIRRVLFFTSGLFFSSTTFPSYVVKYLWYNPIFQLIEWARCSISQGYSTIPIWHMYIIMWVLCSLCLGFLLERYVRRKNFA